MEPEGSLLCSLILSWVKVSFQIRGPLIRFSNNPTFFMEPEGSLPCSQKPAYPEPAESNLHHRPVSP